MASQFDAWIEDDEGAEPRTVSPDNDNAEGSFDWHKDENGDLFVNSFVSLDEIPDEASISDDPFQESNMEEDVLEEPEGYKNRQIAREMTWIEFCDRSGIAEPQKSSI